MNIMRREMEGVRQNQTELTEMKNKTSAIKFPWIALTAS